MKLVAGLGNPGKKYVGTRHNIGFEVIELLAQQFVAATGRLKFEGHLQECLVGPEKTLLLMPQTFMNLSGRSIRQVMDFYKIDPDDLLVVCDDFNLPLGTIRLRAAGSDGGQKGLADTIRQLGTDRIARLRLGIGPVPAEWDAADYVLGKFTSQDRDILENQTKRSTQAIEVWVNQGITLAMSQFNGSLPDVG